MGNYIRLEFKRILNSRKYKVIIYGLLLLTIGAYLYTCMLNYEKDLSRVRAASEMGIIEGIPSQYALNILVISLPIIASVIYADSYNIEYENGAYKNIITKISRKKYLMSKVIVNFTVVFISFFCILGINEILTLSTFPSEGYFNNYGNAAYDIVINEEFFLDRIRVYNPNLHNMIIIIIYSLIASLVSTFTLIISYVNSKKWIITLFSVFLGYNGLMLVSMLIGIEKISLTSYIGTVKVGDPYTLMGLVIVLITTMYIVYKYAIMKPKEL